MNIIRIRKCASANDGEVGLFWVGNTGTILTTDKDKVADLAAKLTDIPEWISTKRTHEQSFKDFDKKTIIDEGGNPKSYRSLPRGFVAYDVDNSTFHIVGGDWLDSDIEQKIKDVFHINVPATTYINGDYNATK
jgi:hypothetical protein